MSHRIAPRLALALFAASSLLVAGCSSSDGGSEGAAADTEETTETTVAAEAEADDCPEETTYQIEGPDGPQEFTAASAYAYESADYLSIYLFSEEVPEDEIQSISTGFRTDDPGTIFASLHTRAEPGDESVITTGEYVADSAAAQQELAAGSWVTDVAVSLGLEQIATGFPADPATSVTIDVIDDEKICGTIDHPAGSANFTAVHLVSGS